ncbi:MocR-like pyridoxine biosynthesis transcription factor PdxR [Agromyces bauzanensis]
MTQNWTSFEVVLALAVPQGSRFGRRLQAALRDAVRDGRLGPGDALPSTRELATELDVARGTIVQVYEQLAAEGYLIATPGARTRVAPHAAGTPPPPSRVQDRARRLRHDLRPGVPDLSRFPAGDWSWALAEAARRVRPIDLDYGDARGHPAALDAIAAHLRRARAAAAHPDAMVIGTGFAQCVALAIDALAARGVRALAVEDPGDRSVDEVARRAGLELRAIPVDGDGIDVDRLAACGAGAVIVTPTHQSPTGAVLSPARRTALTDWAVRTGGWIVEDDYDSEFRYDRQPIGALQGLAPDRVLLIGSASKTHVPGLRLAWMAVPPPLVDEIRAAKRAADRGGSAIDQLAFALLIESGRHDRHVRAMRAVYRARREALVAALARVAPSLRLTGLAAGFHGVLALPPGRSEAAVMAAATERSLRVVGLGASTLARLDLPPSLVIGFGNIDAAQLPEAASNLAAAIGDAEPARGTSR